MPPKYDDSTLQPLLYSFFHQQIQQNDMLNILDRNYNIQLSRKTLQRSLKRFHLIRTDAKVKPSDEALREVIANAQNGPISSLGYRMLQHHLLMKHGWRVSRDTVMTLNRELHPESVKARRRRRLKRRAYISNGPNDAWHIDQHDKLKQYGFPLHACVDGFSRRIMWLEYVPSNNDPQVVLALYLREIERQGGAPQLTRTDWGSENILVATAQRFFRNSMTAHRYGSSTSNTRVESIWCEMLQGETLWWILYFGMLVEQGHYDVSNPTHKALAVYIHLPLMQQTLELWVKGWNFHYIRGSGRSCPKGKPNVNFDLPSKHGCSNQNVPVCSESIALVRKELFRSDIKQWIEPTMLCFCINLVDMVLNQTGYTDITLENCSEVFKSSAECLK